jgi:putative DNA primase/helicase
MTRCSTRAPNEIGGVGLLVLDEGFWGAGLRGTDGKALLTLDGLRPHLGTVQCWNAGNKEDWEATADLAAHRERLWKVLASAGNGPLSVAALRAAGLTPERCRQAAGLEHRRMRNPGITPGMDPGERRRRIAAVLPKEGEPWAPPNRAAAMWLLNAEALENDHDAAGVVLVDTMSENGTVRCLRLTWRADLRNGWGADGPILHLDATLRPELVTPFIPEVTIAEPLMATAPHMRVRQILRAPVSAKALTPGEDAKPRDRSAAVNHRRQVSALIALRAANLRGRNASSPDLLIIAQKAAVDALRAAGLPRNVQAVHFNALSGIDRWRNVAGLMVLGRTLPAPLTVEALAAAVTNCPPLASRRDVDWWYEQEERRIALADGGVHRLSGETHADPTVEAIRWTICEGELIQAIGRGRGVNRTAATPLEVDLLTDVVLPVAVHEVLDWADVCPSRQDMMAASGVVLENAADMARAFPDLWPSHDAARQQKARSVTSCYYRDLSNSRTSHSSSVVAYRPAGPGQKDRTARFDLVLVPDPRAWLESRMGPLAHFEVVGGAAPEPATPPIADARVRLTALSVRLDAALAQRITHDRARLTALSYRMEAAQPNPAAA